MFLFVQKELFPIIEADDIDGYAEDTPLEREGNRVSFIRPLVM